MKTRRPEKIILRVGKELKDKAFPLGSSNATAQPPLENLVGKTYGFHLIFSLRPFPSLIFLFSFFYYYFSIFRSVSRFVLINSANSALQFSFARSPLWHRCKWLVTETRWQKRHGYETPARETFVLFTTNSGVYQQRLQQRWHVSSVTERFAN